MKFSLRFNNDTDPHSFVELAQIAERAGFDQIWVSHDLFLHAAPVLITAAATATDRIHLGSGILNPYSANPAELAMTATSLQELSGGRFLLGLGAGAQEFLGWAGIERTRPLSRTREAVHALQSLLSGESPAHNPGAGDGWQTGAFMRIPTGVPPPIYLGVMGPKMTVLAGEIADGALPLLFPPEHFPIAANRIAEGADRAGRETESLDLAACVWVSIDDDADAARNALAQKVAYYGPSFSVHLLAAAGLSLEDFAPIKAALDTEGLQASAKLVTPEMLQLGIAGSADDVIQRGQWLIDNGARHVSFGPPLGPNPAAAVELLGAKVLPALRSHKPAA